MNCVCLTTFTISPSGVYQAGFLLLHASLGRGMHAFLYFKMLKNYKDITLQFTADAICFQHA